MCSRNSCYWYNWYCRPFLVAKGQWRQTIGYLRVRHLGICHDINWVAGFCSWKYIFCSLSDPIAHYVTNSLGSIVDISAQLLLLVYDCSGYICSMHEAWSCFSFAFESILANSLQSNCYQWLNRDDIYPRSAIDRAQTLVSVVSKNYRTRMHPDINQKEAAGNMLFSRPMASLRFSDL